MTAEPTQTPAPDEAPVYVPTAGDLAQVALSLAVIGDEADQAAAKYGTARKAAEEVFALARRHGTKQIEVTLPDGTELGLISIEKGAKVVTANEDELLFLVATTVPAEVEDYIVPGAMGSEHVLEVLREHCPEVVNRRIRPAYRQQLQAEMDERDGWVVNQKSGDLTEVGKVTRYEPSGKFSYRKDRKKLAALREAVTAGLISETGEVLALPAGDGGEQ